MKKTDKRWQLLLMADDGRIIPFKRIKGLALTLVVLLVLLALVCAGLAWRLTIINGMHRQTLDQLSDANRQVARYKSEHELMTAELVLAEARMEKAGLPVPSRQRRINQQVPEKTVDAETAPDTMVDQAEQPTQRSTTTDPTAAKKPSHPPTTSPDAKAVVAKKAPVALQGASVEASATPVQPVVELGDLELNHDGGNNVLLARFRVKNTGPRTSPVAGRCVVVLKNDRMDRQAWMAMPEVALVNGEPDGENGQAFKISRFIDMRIKAAVQEDPSSFNRATVYVFNAAGSKLLEKNFSIDLPASGPAAANVSTFADQPADNSAMSNASAVSSPSSPASGPKKAPAPAAGATDEADNPPKASAPDTDGGKRPLPAVTETPAEGADPQSKPDARARF